MKKNKEEQLNNNPYSTFAEKINSATLIYRGYLKLMPYLISLGITLSGEAISKIVLPAISLGMREIIKYVSEKVMEVIIDSQDNTIDGGISIDGQRINKNAALQLSLISEGDDILLEELLKGMIAYNKGEIEGNVPENKVEADPITIEQLANINDKEFIINDIIPILAPGVASDIMSSFPNITMQIVEQLSSPFKVMPESILGFILTAGVRKISTKITKKGIGMSADVKDGIIDGKFHGLDITKTLALAKLAGYDVNKFNYLKDNIIIPYETSKQEKINDEIKEFKQISKPSFLQNLAKIIIKNKGLMKYKKVREFVDGQVLKNLSECKKEGLDHVDPNRTPAGQEFANSLSENINKLSTEEHEFPFSGRTGSDPYKSH